MKAVFYAGKLTKTAIRWIEVESFKGMETYIIEMMAVKGKRMKSSIFTTQQSPH